MCVGLLVVCADNKGLLWACPRYTHIVTVIGKDWVYPIPTGVVSQSVGHGAGECSPAPAANMACVLLIVEVGAPVFLVPALPHSMYGWCCLVPQYVVCGAHGQPVCGPASV